MYFLLKCEKNQEKPKVFEKALEKTQGPQEKIQEPKIRSKNPSKILGENPRSGNADGRRLRQKFVLAYYSYS